MRGNEVILEAGKIYRSRRGERVLITSIEPSGDWPVHFIVQDGRYKGVGLRDGSRLRIDGRARASANGIFKDHLNDLIAEWPGDHAKAEMGAVVHVPEARKRELRRRAG
jgi:hypothetical protein